MRPKMFSNRNVVLTEFIFYGKAFYRVTTKSVLLTMKENVKNREGRGARTGFLLALLGFCMLAVAFETLANSVDSHLKDQDWSVYGGGPGNDHFSPLTQINTKNVKRLHVVWSFDTGEVGGLETSP